MLSIYYLDKGLKQASPEDLPRIKNKHLWIDVISITPQEAKILQETFRLHPLTTEDLIHDKTRIKVEQFPNYLFCVFYGIRKSTELELVDIDFVIGKNFIISNHITEIAATKELLANPEKMAKLLAKGPDFLFHRLLDSEIDNYFPVLEEIDDLITSLEEEVTEKPHSKIMQKILELKRSVIRIKKTAFNQREKASYLAKNEYLFISEGSVPYFRDIYDHAIRVSDILDNYREALGNAFDVYMSSVSNNMNEVMKTLSIFATIALPLTAISSIYGTNFANLPGSQFPYGFWVMILIMLVLSIVMLISFKRRGWF